SRGPCAAAGAAAASATATLPNHSVSPLASTYFPRNSPMGASASVWSQKILVAARSGTAMNAPGTPQMKNQTASPTKMATGLSVSRRPNSGGLTKFDWMSDTMKNPAGTSIACPTLLNVVSPAIARIAIIVPAPRYGMNSSRAASTPQSTGFGIPSSAMMRATTMPSETLM